MGYAVGAPIDGMPTNNKEPSMRKHFALLTLAVAAAAAAVGCASPGTMSSGTATGGTMVTTMPSPMPAGMPVAGKTEVLWLGQASTRITTPGGKVIVIDP